MKIFLSDQKSNFERHLCVLKEIRAVDFDRTQLTEKTSTIDLDTQASFDNLNLQSLFDYKIFPDYILTFLPEWEIENRNMKIGDTIVQQVYLPPVKNFSLKFIFGVRISEIIDETNRKGFSYITLEGHAENGISTFTTEMLNNKIKFKIQTFSEPGNFWSKILGPLFTLPYQTFCTRKALINIKQKIDLANDQ